MDAKYLSRIFLRLHLLGLNAYKVEFTQVGELRVLYSCAMCKKTQCEIVKKINVIPSIKQNSQTLIAVILISWCLNAKKQEPITSMLVVLINL